MQNNYGRTEGPDMEYAGFWVRLAAYCIDSVIIWIGLLFVKLIISILSIGVGSVFRTELLFQYTAKDIILYVLQVLYFILLTHGTGTTPGKKLMNLRVVNADGSQELDLLNIIYRETIGRFLCGLSMGIGYIMAGVDREKKGLHDMLCDTRVVYAKKIKVFPVYQAPKNYPMTPPGIGPMPPQGNGHMGPVGGPMPPQGNGSGGPGIGPMPPQGNGPTGPVGGPMPLQGNDSDVAVD